MSKDKETIYERYFFHIWLSGSFVFCLLYLYFVEGVELSVENLFPGVFTLVLVLPIIAIFLGSMFALFTFACSLIIDGVKDKDPWSILGAFWLLVGIVMFLMGCEA